jgi:lipid-A-disaccharide synthase
MRVFFSTGELSGELLAAELLGAMRARMPVDAEAIGNTRLEAEDVRIVHRTIGWARVGIYDAIKIVPQLIGVLMQMVVYLRRSSPDVVVLIDFGAFNLRLARALRAWGFKKPIVYYVPPSAWLDNLPKAQTVAQNCDALTIFRHQSEFYRAHALPIGYVGHPLVSTIAARPPRPAPPPNGGRIALLPGSRHSEIARHLPLLLDAFSHLRERRPDLTGVIVAANDEMRALIQATLDFRSPGPITIAEGTRAVLADVDVAAVTSGTAVLEAALIGTPTASFYILGAAQARIAARVFDGTFITLPNLVLRERIVPELLQDAATPVALADALAGLLDDPAAQLDGFARMRTALGPPDSLQRIADWVIAAAESAAH